MGKGAKGTAEATVDENAVGPLVAVDTAETNEVETEACDGDITPCAAEG